jgi:hypothetical protein
MINLLYLWQKWGVYDVLLPFLFIFAVVFGILTWINLFGKNKPVCVIISLVIGLMAIRVDYVSRFFSEIFPRVGVGLAVLLALVILAGMFIVNDEKRYWAWGISAVGFIVWVISVGASFQDFGFGWGGNIEEYAGMIIGAVVVIGVIIAVSASGGSSDGEGKKKKVKLSGSIGPGPLWAPVQVEEGG